jgi:hypothetical protein
MPNNNNLGGSNLGGGPYNGWSPKQSINNSKSSDQSMVRGILRRSWNTMYATNNFNNKNRIVTPFRAVNNNGDFLCRKNYACGGPNAVTIDRYKKKNNIGSMPQQCDNTGVPASSCNTKFVPDSSDYITFKKQQAINKTYNDLKFGGDQSHASYANIMAIRRF